MSITYPHSAPVRSAAPSWRRRSRLAAWLGLALLTLTVFANGAMPAPAKGMTTPIEQQLFGDRIVICTPGGLMVVDRDGKPVPADDGVQHAQICVFCLPLMHAGLNVPPLIDDVSTNRTVPAVAAFFPAFAAFARARIDLGAASPRGPPLV
jgi:hypothetical protein